MNKKIYVMILSFMFIISNIIIISNDVDAEEQIPTIQPQYNMSGRIVIDIMDDFQMYASGDGTEFDPYIIENVEINGMGESGSCIYISVDDLVYVIIRNSYLHNSSYDDPFGMPPVDPPDEMTYGISIYCPNMYLTIENVISENHTVIGMNNGAGGIFIQECASVNIIDCTIKYNEDGIIAQTIGINPCLIDNNIIHNVNQGGLMFYASGINHVISNNDVSLSAWGLAVFANNVEVSNNTCYNNPTFYGLYIIGMENSKICFNTLRNNDMGISLWDTADNIIFNNTIQDNRIGIKVLDSQHDHLFWNRIINNTNQYDFDSASPYWWNLSYENGGGNYWSDYNGTDIYSGPNQDEVGRDYIGDTPYLIGTITDYYPLINVSGWVNLTIPKVVDITQTNLTFNITFYEIMNITSDGATAINGTNESFEWINTTTLKITIPSLEANETFDLNITGFESKTGYVMEEFNTIFSTPPIVDTSPGELTPESEDVESVSTWVIIQNLIIGFLSIILIIIILKKFMERLDTEFNEK